MVVDWGDVTVCNMEYAGRRICEKWMVKCTLKKLVANSDY